MKTGCQCEGCVITFKFALREDIKDDKRFLPTRAEPLATGWDVCAAMEDRKPLVIRPFEHVKIPLGVRSFCPDGWWYALNPRSSTFAKKHLHALYGTIDESYEGQLIAAVQYIPSLIYDDKSARPTEDFLSYCLYHALEIEFGEAIGQIIPRRREEIVVKEVSNEDYDSLCKARNGVRGAGGFGSTSK